MLFFVGLGLGTGAAYAKDGEAKRKNSLVSGNFITEWDLSKPRHPSAGVTTSINFGVNVSGTVHYTWRSSAGESGSGTITASTPKLEIRELPQDGKITLELEPANLTGFYMNKSDDKQRLVNVAQWGTAKWSSMAYMLYGCISLDIDAVDIPDLSSTGSVQEMFTGCSSLTGPQNIAAWDISEMIYMSGIFKDASSFNQNISAWDVSSGTDMSDMFSGATSFNQNLGSWNLKEVTNLIGVFDNSGMDCMNYSATLMGWAANPNTNIITDGSLHLGATGIEYGTNAQAARTKLTGENGWQIYGDVDGKGICESGRDFITEWDMSKTGSSAVNSPTAITFNVEANGPVDYIWTTLDGTTESGVLAVNNSRATIPNIPVGSRFVLSLGSSNLTYFALYNADSRRLVDVKQWGTSKWKSMENAYSNSSLENVSAEDIPDLSGVTSMEGMFRSSGSLLSVRHIGLWDTDNVKNMSSLFSSAALFNEDISHWKTSNVENMSFMFWQAGAFNHALDSWNTKNVTTMSNMFCGAEVFNQDLDSWNTSSVTDMHGMFEGAKAFNGNIGSWDIRNVTNMSMMFESTESFNQNISNWKIDAADNMEYMFQHAKVFNQDLSQWNTENVTVMGFMFNEAKAFNQNLGRWNLSNVNGISNIFDNSGMDCINYSNTLIGWATNPDTPDDLFLGGEGLTYGTNAQAAHNVLTVAKGWEIADDVAGIEACVSPNLFITEWDLSKNLIAGYIRFKVEVSGEVSYTWVTTDGTKSGDGTISNGQTDVYISGLPVGSKVVLNLESQNLKYFSISGGVKAHLVDVRQWGTSTWTNMEWAFSGAESLTVVTAKDIPDLSQVRSMWYMFDGCKTLVSVTNMELWNTEHITKMACLFRGSTQFNQNIGSWNTKNVEDMSAMFLWAKSFNQDIGNWNTEKVKDMSTMFSEAEAFNQNLDKWNVGSVENMERMFNYASLFNGNIDNWDTQKVTTMGSMFSGASAFNRDITGWNIEQVENMESMFSEASVFNQDLSKWDVQNVQAMTMMLYNAKAFNQDLGGWNLSAVTDLYLILDSSGMDCFNYSSTLNGWAANLNTPVDLPLGGAGLTYGLSATEAHDRLVSDKGWDIPDDIAGMEYCAAQVAQTIDPIADIVKIYGDPAFDPGATATSGLEVSYVSADNSIAEYNSANKVIEIKKVGVVRITAQQPGSVKYLAAPDVTFELTVKPAALTVAAQAKTKMYGDRDPELSYMVNTNDLKNGDTDAVLTGKLTRIPGEDVGTYPIELGSLEATNYTIDYVGANLEITKAALTGLLLEDVEFDYDGTAKSLLLKGTGIELLDVEYHGNNQINAGSYKVTAEVKANANHEGGVFTATLLIHKAKQTITFHAPEEIKRSTPTITLEAIATSGLQVALHVNGAPIKMSTKEEIRELLKGATLVVTAVQPGNENYEAAVPVEATIRIVDDEKSTVIRPHRAVSPNYDGINEFFQLDGIEDHLDNKVTIFDKNGVVMAEIVGYNNQDKKYTGEWHRDGTYYYYLDVKENGKWRREKGYFVVRR
ncbi:hypothetical protein M472_01215 [Sphingobacterium paucimobilis HER1398]|uniref:MBG domain-containing protein n=2 Tax=Sphingobacterium TaxID=28453 RepID=U2H6P0_9SPHI|nr:hypothetical protein M472_01215 [Sphingobacterium paucimobilis HER1398]